MKNFNLNSSLFFCFFTYYMDTVYETLWQLYKGRKWTSLMSDVKIHKLYSKMLKKLVNFTYNLRNNIDITCNM
jgi:hypothetical protein